MKWILVLLAFLFVVPAEAQQRRRSTVAYRRVITNSTAPAGFTYTSTDFDGSNDWLTRGADLTGIADSKNLLFSLWFKRSAAGTVQQVLAGSDDLYLKVNFDTDNVLYFRFANALAGGTYAFTCFTTTPITDTTTWHQIILSVALPGSYQLYVDGVEDITSYTHADLTMDLESKLTNIAFGAAVGGGQKFDALVSEIYFTQPAAFFDLSVGANLLKFRTAGGKPANLGADGSTPTGTQPLVYLHNPFGTFQNNLGSGGNFTVTGTLGDGGADIP